VKSSITDPTEEPFERAVARRVKDARTAMQMSRNELAKQARVAAVIVAQVETGNGRTVSVGALKAILRVCGLHLKLGVDGVVVRSRGVA
jgi:transcriptional regulator with XRE-family HTH domain